MSFGFSIGDFITVGSLIHNIVSSLRASSISEYRELILELHGLQLAVNEIEHLKCQPNQEPAVNGIKVAALMCQYPLNEFAGKLKKFDSLFTADAGNVSNTDKMKMWGKKLKWGFCMKEEVLNLRTYLVVHVGSLNMRLATQGLSSASSEADRCQKGLENLETLAEKSCAEMVQVRQDIQVAESLERNNNSVLTKLFNLITGDVVSQLQNLIDLATKVWQSNLKIMSFFAKLETSNPSPERRYTWFQEPIKFEDATGRVIPIASEYNWEMVEAVIAARFKHVGGYEEIKTDYYELYNTLDSSQIISRARNEMLMPGLSMTMAIIVHDYIGPGQCPRPSCSSKRSTKNESEDRTWAYFGPAHNNSLSTRYQTPLQLMRRQETKRKLLKNFRYIPRIP